jgi:exopolysaccharide production protein ExoY
VAHRRIGYCGRPLWMLKFRSMWPGARSFGTPRLVERLQPDLVPVDKSQPDPRVSHWLGRFLRRSSFDELPQLLHVVRGEMAFVGPRPITEDELERHYSGAATQVLSRRPGMTGLWQVMGRSKLTYRQRRRLDLFWVRHQGPGLALWVMARTIPAVLTRENAH